MITKAEALRLSILKWEYIVNNDGQCVNITRDLPQLIGFPSLCGLCQYAKDLAILSGIKDEANLQHRHKCIFCDLSKLDTSCYDISSYFQTWACNKTKQNAQNVLNLIKQIT